MNKIEVWYTIEKHNGIWTVWKNKEHKEADKGSYGSLGIYSAKTKKDCLYYCQLNNIKL